MAGHHRESKSAVKWEISFDYFLTKAEIKTLRSWAKRQRNASPSSRTAWMEWFLIEVGYNSGLRVSEIADLQCGDIRLCNELSYILVRKGKGGKQRQVLIGSRFQTAIRDFFAWKKRNGEPTIEDAVVLVSPRSSGRYSRRALQLAFKRCLKKAGLTVGHSIHHLRHTYASFLFSSSKNNLPLVQKQLGHSSVMTTQVYAHVFKEEIERAVERLF